MINFKNKYLKYKEKYLELKNTNLIGGDPDTFYLYVTGIADGFSYGYQYLEYWNETLKRKIIEKIPDNFTKIEITYYDPLDYGADLTNREEIITECTSKLDVPCNRVVKNEFIAENFPIPFEFGEKKYLIVDLAHIFAYTSTPGKVLYDATEYNYHVLYLGYLGEEQTNYGYNNRAIVDEEFLTITPDGNVETWIDKFTSLKYTIDPHNVTDLFSKFIKIFWSSITRLYVDKYFENTIESRNNRSKLFDKIEKKLNESELCSKMLNLIFRSMSESESESESEFTSQENLIVILQQDIGIELLNLKPEEIPY